MKYIVMNFDLPPIPLEQERKRLLDKLTDAKTAFEERLDLVKRLFPEKRKQEMLDQADKDRKGRPVRYFRYLSYPELKAILETRDVNGLDNLYARETFVSFAREIKEGLKLFLETEEIFDQYHEDFERLVADFTLENYRSFVQTKLPMGTLLRLHVSVMGGGNNFSGATGLSSLSVGAPFMPPVDPSTERRQDQEGLPVIEMVIPSDDIIINPRVGHLREMEKEVNATTIKPEWIVDIYCGTSDFAKRFVRDPNTVLFPGFKEREARGEIWMDWISDGNVWDILQEWKGREDIIDLIPANKVEELNPENPRLQKPLKEAISGP